jgi:hypothetical protein
VATHAVSEKPYELAYEASIRAIENQAATVESLRSRAGTILAATALVTSFFGGQALSRTAGRYAIAAPKRTGYEQARFVRRRCRDRIPCR